MASLPEISQKTAAYLSTALHYRLNLSVRVPNLPMVDLSRRRPRRSFQRRRKYPPDLVRREPSPGEKTRLFRPLTIVTGATVAEALAPGALQLRLPARVSGIELLDNQIFRYPPLAQPPADLVRSVTAAAASMHHALDETAIANPPAGTEFCDHGIDYGRRVWETMLEPTGKLGDGIFTPGQQRPRRSIDVGRLRRGLRSAVPLGVHLRRCAPGL